MKYAFAFLLGFSLVTGCGVKSVPVITSTKEVVKEVKDTTQDSTTHSSDSVSTTYKPQVLPGAIIDESKTVDAWDSVIQALVNMPPYTPIVYSDGKLKAQLKFYKDSINHIHTRCEALDQTYFEKETSYKRYIETLVNKTTSLQKENTLLRSEVKVQKERWGSRVWSGIKTFFRNSITLLIILIIIFGIVMLVVKYLKKLRMR